MESVDKFRRWKNHLTLYVFDVDSIVNKVVIGRTIFAPADTVLVYFTALTPAGLYTRGSAALIKHISKAVASLGFRSQS